jgi:hypothetical protein
LEASHTLAADLIQRAAIKGVSMKVEIGAAGGTWAVRRPLAGRFPPTTDVINVAAARAVSNANACVLPVLYGYAFRKVLETIENALRADQAKMIEAE